MAYGPSLVLSIFLPTAKVSSQYVKLHSASCSRRQSVNGGLGVGLRVNIDPLSTPRHPPDDDISGQLKERWGVGDAASSLLTSSVNIGECCRHTLEDA